MLVSRQYLRDLADGSKGPVSGAVRCTPTRRRDTPDGLGDIMPSGFTTVLDADGWFRAELDESGVDWAWGITEAIPHGEHYWVAVGAGATGDLGDLVRVDPATLDPAAAPEAAWWALWNAMAAGTYLVPDPINVGLYIPTEANPMTPDPAHAGLYTIGALA